MKENFCLKYFPINTDSNLFIEYFSNIEMVGQLEKNDCDKINDFLFRPRRHQSSKRERC